VQTRDSAATGHFVYAVRTTGVYCQPACSSRLAKRQNVEFFNDAHQAEAAGYRACKRCAGGTQRPTPQRSGGPRLPPDRSQRPAPNLDQLSADLNLSPFHLHRLFKAETGLTPKAYASAFRARRLREAWRLRPVSPRPSMTPATTPTAASMKVPPSAWACAP
jgi:AraC family transcriptional regulator of adaptative response/methylated-DNA-[protein]-cysteine methyltransferase